MGYMRSHAILVTDHGYGEALDRAHDMAKGLQLIVSEIVAGHVNGVRSFFVAPDGSKEGWEASNAFDERRECFVEYLRSVVYEDGSSPLSWAEVQYGDDRNDTRIVRSSDDDQKAAVR